MPLGTRSGVLGFPEAALEKPDDAVRSVVFPAVTSGEQTLRELVHEFKMKGPVYRRTAQTTLRIVLYRLPPRPLGGRLYHVLATAGQARLTGIGGAPFTVTSRLPVGETN